MPEHMICQPQAGLPPLASTRPKVEASGTDSATETGPTPALDALEHRATILQRRYRKSIGHSGKTGDEQRRYYEPGTAIGSSRRTRTPKRPAETTLDPHCSMILQTISWNLQLGQRRYKLPSAQCQGEFLAPEFTEEPQVQNDQGLGESADYSA